jgi:predicted permease
MLPRLQQIIARIGSYFQSSRLDQDLDHELEAHIAAAVEQNIRKGMSEQQALRTARVELGGVTQLREEHRETRGLPFVDALLQDLRYTFRTLRRDAGFTTFAILIAGLGIGASATVFSVVNAVLLRPLPFKDSGRLVWIGNVADDRVSEWTLQVNNVLDLRQQSKSFSDIAGYFGFSKVGDNKITGDGDPVRLTGASVSCNFFPLLGVAAYSGRLFSADECRWNGPKAVLLSYGLWKTRYASDPGVIGRRLTINETPVTVIGIMPESFDFGSVFTPGVHMDLYSPFPLTEETNRWGNTLGVVGRLNSGATVQSAQAELTILGKQIEDRHQKDRASLRPILRSLDEHVNGHFRPALFVLAAAVGVVMLIVCANLANLQMARAAGRQKEMAIRVALGAGRRRLVRQMLTESLVLACLGAVPGLILAVAGTRAFAHLESFNIPLLNSIRIDGAALGFTAALAVVTGLIFGLVAALQAPLTAVHDTLKDSNRGAGGGGRRHNWVRGALVVTEVAFACVLLVGTGLLVRSFLHVLDVNLGFQPERAASLRIDPSGKYETQEKRNAYLSEVLRIARSMRGIISAGVTDTLPFTEAERSWDVAGQGQQLESGHSPEGFVRIISDGYLHTAGIPLIAGRDFTERDTLGTESVALINETLARTLWPGQNPIGQVINQDKGRRVVGVVADVRHRTLEDAAGCEMYFPLRQRGDWNGINLVVRTNLPPVELASSIRMALKPIEPNLGSIEFRTLQDLVDRAASPRRFVVLLLAGFSAFALILAALGIYALIAYSVNQRTQEFGIRTALGAGAGDLQGRVLAETLSLAGVGVVIGLAGSWFLGRALSGLLFGVTAGDPLTFAAMVGVLGAVAAMAGYVPARRASRIDPMIALRGN